MVPLHCGFQSSSTAVIIKGVYHVRGNRYGQSETTQPSLFSDAKVMQWLQKKTFKSVL